MKQRKTGSGVVIQAVNFSHDLSMYTAAERFAHKVPVPIGIFGDGVATLMIDTVTRSMDDDRSIIVAGCFEEVIHHFPEERFFVAALDLNVHRIGLLKSSRFGVLLPLRSAFSNTMLCANEGRLLATEFESLRSRFVLPLIK